MITALYPKLEKQIFFTITNNDNTNEDEVLILGNDLAIEPLVIKDKKIALLYLPKESIYLTLEYPKIMRILGGRLGKYFLFAIEDDRSFRLQRLIVNGRKRDGNFWIHDPMIEEFEAMEM